MADQTRPPTSPVFNVNGAPYVVLRPAVESLGLDFEAQLADLRRRAWATCVDVPTGDEHGRATGTEVVVDLRTWLMFLACLDADQVAAEARPALVAYQTETVNNALWGPLGRPGGSA